MISRSAISRGTQAALRRQACGKVAKRGFAAAASESVTYEPTNVAGINVASRDDNGPTTRLAVVAKAGTRYQPLPGLTAGLEEFAFKSTERRSALRIVRESELLGGQLTAYHTREALVFQASFLREHLPYFTELLAEVLTQTKYTTHEFHEEVERVIHTKQAKIDAAALALDAAHSVAFHTGLGAPANLHSSVPVSSYLNEHSVASFASLAYTKPNVAVVADGASQAGISKWVDQFFKTVPSTPPVSPAAAEQFGQWVEKTTGTKPVRITEHSKLPNENDSKYYGGEHREAKAGVNSLVMAFPGYSLSSTNPEAAVLVALLGGSSSIKWTPGFTLLAKAAAGAAPGTSVSATNYAYSDAGLLAIQVNGTASQVRKVAEESVKALKSIAESPVSKEDLTKAIAKAKFDLLSASETSGTGLVWTGANLIHGGSTLQVAAAVKSLESVTAEKLKAAAKGLLDGKAAVAAVGDLHVLPFAEELGLKV